VRRLIVVGKYPRPGYAKTRLASDIGPVAAAGVYARMLYRLLLSIVDADFPEIGLELSLASAGDVDFFAEAFPEFEVRAQQDGDLGDRLRAEFQCAFASGAEAVTIVASDTPALSPDVIRAAFDVLDDAPVVLGPCVDGGYYLIGMRKPVVDLFSGVEWGTERVMAQTEALARAHGVAIAHLVELFDVDTAEDLTAWHDNLARAA
jgi:hypothetical protein